MTTIEFHGIEMLKPTNDTSSIQEAHKSGFFFLDVTFLKPDTGVFVSDGLTRLSAVDIEQTLLHSNLTFKMLFEKNVTRWFQS